MECQIWGLERYARLTSQTGTHTVPENDSWEHFDNTSEKLELTVTSSDYMLLHHGKKQLESVFLAGASSWVKGVSKVDSLMVVFKIQNTNHRFRVKFSPSVDKSGEVCCKECIDRLGKHFPVKIPASTGPSSQQVSETPQSTPTGGAMLVDDVTIGQLAQTITSPNGLPLPAAYNRYHGDISGVDLNTAVKLCLTDPTFPAFVGLVEQEVEKIQKDCS